MALTKAELTDSLQNELGSSRAECKDFVDQFFSVMVETLARGERITLSGFGNFAVHNMRERPDRTLQTGGEVPLAARRVVTFHAGNTLRSKLADAAPRDALGGSGNQNR